MNIYTCMTCGKDWVNGAKYLGEAGIASRDGLTWVRVELSDADIKGLARGVLKLCTVSSAFVPPPATPAPPPPLQSPGDPSSAVSADLLRLAMSAALFEARDRLVALSLELEARRNLPPSPTPLERVQEWVSGGAT